MNTNPNETMSHMTIDQEQLQKYIGLTKREYFAAMALQGFLASEEKGYPNQFTNSAVQAADALIAALNAEAQDDKE